jgi:stearoyl-CoA desaturase (delta-9 desaturase)
MTINSFDHMYGSRRYNTPDTSRNNLLLALITLGEGWHNNHHHFAVSARQGFFWWEIDMTYYLLVVMSWLGIVKELRPVPEHVLNKNRINANTLNQK